MEEDKKLLSFLESEDNELVLLGLGYLGKLYNINRIKVRDLEDNFIWMDYDNFINIHNILDFCGFGKIVYYDIIGRKNKLISQNGQLSIIKNPSKYDVLHYLWVSSYLESGKRQFGYPTLIFDYK